jgi:hypothetical protein
VTRGICTQWAPLFVFLSVLAGLPTPLLQAQARTESPTKLLSIQIGQSERQILDTLGAPSRKTSDHWDFPEGRIEFTDSKVTQVQIELEQAIDPLKHFPSTLQGYLSPIPHAADTLIPGVLFSVPEQGLEIRLSPGGKSADITRNIPKKQTDLRERKQVSLEEAIRSLQSPAPATPARPILKSRAR